MYLIFFAVGNFVYKREHNNVVQRQTMGVVYSKVGSLVLVRPQEFWSHYQKMKKQLWYNWNHGLTTRKKF